MNNPLNIFSIGSCRVKGFRSKLPSYINLNYFENHVHNPHEHLQLLRFAQKTDNFYLPTDILSKYLSLTDEVFLRVERNPAVTIERYVNSIEKIALSDIIMLEFSSLKNIMSEKITFNDRPINANITCNRVLRDQNSSLHINAAPSVVTKQSAIKLIQKIIGLKIFSKKKFLLVPHFQYKASNKDSFEKNTDEKWLLPRKTLRDAIVSAAELSSPDQNIIKIFDPSDLNESLPNKDLFEDSAHYNNERLDYVANRITDLSCQLYDS